MQIPNSPFLIEVMHRTCDEGELVHVAVSNVPYDPSQGGHYKGSKLICGSKCCISYSCIVVFSWSSESLERAELH